MLWGLGFVCAMIVIAAPKPAVAQTGSIQAEMLKDWTGLKDTMVKIANEMPEDKYGYKSTPAQRDYGAQVLHIAQVNMGFLGASGRQDADAHDRHEGHGQSRHDEGAGGFVRLRSRDPQGADRSNDARDRPGAVHRPRHARASSRS